MTHRRRPWAVDIITRTIVSLVPRAAEADTTVSVAYRSKQMGQNSQDTWSGRPDGIAERIATALYGHDDAPAQQSPLAQAHEAEKGRDAMGEIRALIADAQSLETASWYPARAGDLIHVHYEAWQEIPAFGETYVVEPSPVGAEALHLRLLHHNAFDAAVTGFFAPGDVGDGTELLNSMWSEAGPARLTVVRDGRAVHDGGRQ